MFSGAALARAMALIMMRWRQRPASAARRRVDHYLGWRSEFARIAALPLGALAYGDVRRNRQLDATPLIHSRSRAYIG
jgi:hypothetical protein